MRFLLLGLLPLVLAQSPAQSGRWSVLGKSRFPPLVRTPHRVSQSTRTRSSVSTRSYCQTIDLFVWKDLMFTKEELRYALELLQLLVLIPGSFRSIPNQTAF